MFESTRARMRDVKRRMQGRQPSSRGNVFESERGERTSVLVDAVRPSSIVMTLPGSVERAPSRARVAAVPRKRKREVVDGNALRAQWRRRQRKWREIDTAWGEGDPRSERSWWLGELTAEELSTLLAASDMFGEGKSQKDPSVAALLYYLNSGVFRFQEHKDFGSDGNSPSPDSPDESEYESSGQGSALSDCDVSEQGLRHGCDDSCATASESEPMIEGVTECRFDHEKLEKEIRMEALTQKEMRELVETWFRRHSITHGDLVSFGACGVRLLEREEEPVVEFGRLFLDSPEARLLEFESSDYSRYQEEVTMGSVLIPRSSTGAWERVKPWKIRSCFESDDGKMFHIHPELVQTSVSDPDKGRKFTRLCPRCRGYIFCKAVVPPLSIAAGIDFGDARRLGLEPLSLHEQLIVARVRLYMATIKVSSNRKGRVNLAERQRLQGHAVLFNHDAPIAADIELQAIDELMDPARLESMMQIYFVDAEGNGDKLMHQMLQSSRLLARPWVIYQRLAVLKAVHTGYQHLRLPPYEDFARAVRKSNEVLIQKSARVDEQELIAYEARLGSDLACVQSRETNELLDRERGDGLVDLGSNLGE